MKLNHFILTIAAASIALPMSTMPVKAAEKQPNIILILSDDFGYGDAGPYGGGEGRGMPTPSLDKMAKEGMTFLSNYAQPQLRPKPRPQQATPPRHPPHFPTAW